MDRRALVVAGVAGALLGATVRTATACEPSPELGLDPNLGDGVIDDVPTDGVIAFPAYAWGPLDRALALLEVEVVDASETIVPGAIETIVVSESPGDGSHRLYVVWRPAAPFAAGASLTATVSSVLAAPLAIDPPAPTLVGTLQITIGDAEAGALPVPAIDGLALAASPVPDGRAVCCELGCGAECQTQLQRDRPLLTGDVALADTTLGSQVFVRLLAGTDGVADTPIGELGLGEALPAEGVPYRFAEAASSYCYGAQVVSLIDGSTVDAAVTCVEHGALVLGSHDNPAFSDFVDACLEPLWEDTNEPYAPNGDTEGDGSGDSPDGGGLADDDAAEGCGCRSDGRGPQGWLALAAIAWLVGGDRRGRRRG